MSLERGTHLGPYDILAPLGAGGMGEVYRANDTRLDREVAIKVLPDTFAQDPERLARFQREAKVLASLNHPNIAAIHGFEESDGVRFLVLELVEGETLAERLRRGAMPVEESLEIFKQMAEALEAAHERGVIHRDLKPANVKVTPEGMVKVLDFGLAKAFVGDSSAATIVDSPTITVEHTRPGVVLGTAAYMSPEQARGKPLDKRTDIWSFGCLLYECLTGRRSFAGETTSDTIAKVLERDPEWNALPANTPPTVQFLLRRCLQKDRKRRLHDIGDARLELDDTLSGSMQAWSSAVLAADSSRKVWATRAPWMLAAALAVVVGAFGVAYSRLATRKGAVIRSTIPAPRDARFVFTGDFGGPVVVSPDGRALAFVARDADGDRRLWVRPLDVDTASVLPGTEGAILPFWSPDSRSIGFFANEKLRRVAASGGPVIALCEAPVGKGGTWSREGTILFAPDFRSEIHRVSASGGTPIPVTELDESKHTTHRWPYFLPDGKHFVYLAANHDLSRRQHDAIHFASLDGTENHLVVQTNANAAFASGFLLFMRDSALMAQSFDPKRGQLGGEPIPIAEKVQYDPGIWRGVFAASQNGILAFQVGGDVAGIKLVWFDRSGKKLGSIGEEGMYSGFRLSPDGERLAVDVGDPGDIWIYELARGVRTRVTFDPVAEVSAIWSPDGTRIAYTSRVRPDGKETIFLRPSGGTGGDEMLLESDEEVFATDWSPDGRFLLLWREEGGIWLLPLTGERKPSVLLQIPSEFLLIPFARLGGLFSPDGRWIAYTSNESGRWEVYVVPFVPPSEPNGRTGVPGPAGKWQVSAGGGFQPRWRGDGKELFYQAPDKTLMVAQVNGEGSVFEVGAVQPLFIPTPTASWFTYDVSLDGQRFVVNTVGEEDISPVTLVVNWTAELGK